MKTCHICGSEAICKDMCKQCYDKGRAERHSIKRGEEVRARHYALCYNLWLSVVPEMPSGARSAWFTWDRALRIHNRAHGRTTKARLVAAVKNQGEHFKMRCDCGLEVWI